MKNKMVLIFSLISTVAFAATARAVPVELEVQKVIDSRGSILISLFASAKAWDSEVPTTVVKIPVVSVGTSKLQVDLPVGTYAFFLFQDWDGDGQLARSGVGFPAEPYAFSNNVQIQFSKPSWDDIKFRVTKAGAAATVDLNQP